jgi:hypothetical protein
MLLEFVSNNLRVCITPPHNKVKSGQMYLGVFFIVINAGGAFREVFHSSSVSQTGSKLAPSLATTVLRAGRYLSNAPL